MQGIKRVNRNPAETHVQNFMAATNAYAQQLQLKGEATDFLQAKNAREVYGKLIAMSIALSDPGHAKHNDAYNGIKKALDGEHRDTVDTLVSIGEGFALNRMTLAEGFVKTGLSPEKAIGEAMNSLAGNPVFDHFGNLNLLAAQLYQEMAIMDTFAEYGDVFAVPTEDGGTGLDRSRFRAPYEKVTGSAKTMQGDINPANGLRDDNNDTQISLYNEFKNAKTLFQKFPITQAQQDQIIGYAKAVSPALAGFILQSRLFGAAQKQVMRLAEIEAVGGMDAAGSYVPNVGGSYGFLCSAIMLQLVTWDASAPLAASTADWLANPTKLIQKIQNYNWKPVSTSGPLDPSVDPAKMYLDIIRLAQLYAQNNVDFVPRDMALIVPSTWYALASLYPSGGTFNKQLNEMVTTATGGIIRSIKIIPSSLFNYGADIGAAGTTPYNYMMLIAIGCRQEAKPIILPGRTAIPTVTSESVSASYMRFRTELSFGGPMVMQLGGAFLLEFSKAA